MPSRVPMPMNLCSLLVVICAGSVLFLAGCGSNIQPGEAPTITVQPLSQTVPIGDTTDFSVTASGTAALSYQWSKDGVEIVGATSASYTTPPVALADSGSTFQVTVSDASSSVTSNAVTLTAGARSPKAGDLRYLLWQQVTVPWNNGGEPGNLGATEESVSNALGTPLEIGSTYITSGLCEWHFSVLFLPPPMTGLSMYYQFDNTNDMPYTSYLQSVAASNAVITSMDLEPACNAIGVSWVQTAQTGGFDFRLEAVPASRIQDTVAADGAESRIVTAVTFDEVSGDAIVISYGWQGDTTTTYEAKTAVAMPSDVKNQATILAGDGYFISAFGGNDADGYMLIGMRVLGDSLPRPIGFESGPVSGEDTYAPFTRVVWLAESDYGYTIFEQ